MLERKYDPETGENSVKRRRTRNTKDDRIGR